MKEYLNEARAIITAFDSDPKRGFWFSTYSDYERTIGAIAAALRAAVPPKSRHSIER